MKKKLILSGILVMLSSLLSSCSGLWYVGFLHNKEKYEIKTPEFKSADWEIAEHPGVELLYEKAENTDGLKSMLVAQNGILIAEWYADGYNKERAVNIKSVSKSIIGALVGIAIEEGYISSIDQPIYEILPEYFPPDISEKRNITIRHLLTMSAGFEFTENVNNNLYFSNNWTKSILKQPLSAAPGSGFRYGTIQSHLLSAVLTKVSGMNTLEFAQTHLFDHMRISVNRWDKTPEGIFFGGSEMHLTPRDMAAFGQLYLNDGRYRDQQLVPEGWVRRSTEPSFEEAFRGDSYGYGWWIKQISGYDVYYALGYGGQTITNIPELNLVIVFSANYPKILFDHKKREDSLEDLIASDILPLVLQKSKESF